MDLKLAPHARIERYHAAGHWGDGGLHEFLARNASTTPDQIAIIDPADREDFAPGPPVEMTYADTWFAVDRLGKIFQEMGLESGDLIAIQLPQIVEAPIAILAAARAGLMICLLPPYWQRQEIISSLTCVAPRAILSWSGCETPENNSASQNRMESLREVAAALPSIRFLLAIGDEVPDGIVPLGNFALDAQRHRQNNPDDKAGTSAKEASNPSDADALVAITWPNSIGGPRLALARSHNELKATGLEIAEKASINDGTRLLCPYPLTSFAALGTFLAPWVLSGGCLVLQRAFDVSCFIQLLSTDEFSFSAIPANIEQKVVSAIQQSSTPINLDTLGVIRDLRTGSSRLVAPDLSATVMLDILNISDLALSAKVRTGSGQISVPAIWRSHTSASSAPMLETHLAPARPDDAPGVAELFIRSPMTPSASVGGDGGAFAPLQEAEGFVACGLFARKSGKQFIPIAPVTSDHVTFGNLSLQLAELKSLYGAWENAAAVEIKLRRDAIMGQRVTAHIKLHDDQNNASAEDFKRYLIRAGASAQMMPDEVIFKSELASQTPPPASEASAPLPASPNSPDPLDVMQHLDETIANTG